MAQSHIYLITDKRDGLRYIGQHTGSNDDYFSGGKRVRDEVKKYGKERGRGLFERHVIVQGDFNRALLNELERHYIRLYATKHPLGFNLKGGGAFNKDIGGIPEHKRKIVVYNPNIKEIFYYDSMTSFLGKESLTKISKIKECCREIKAQYKGLIIMYQEKFTKEYLNFRIEKFNKWKISFDTRYIRRVSRKTTKPIVEYDLATGIVTEFDCSRTYLGDEKYDMGLSGKILQCCRGVRKHFQGKIFLFKDRFSDFELNKRIELLKNDKRLHHKTRRLMDPTYAGKRG